MASKEGFIVHPWESSTGQYDASYGNHNKTIKHFKNLRGAKAYLARHGYQKAMYDAPGGTKTVSTHPSAKRKAHRRSSSGFGIRIPSFRF